jgi:hypothetical protein
MKDCLCNNVRIIFNGLAAVHVSANQATISQYVSQYVSMQLANPGSMILCIYYEM